MIRLIQVLAVVGIATAQTRRIKPADLPPALRSQFSAERLEAVTASSDRRLREGEFDHLVYYILQSDAFTRLPRIEPFVSARSFYDGGRHVPANVLARLDAFLAARHDDSRSTYLRKLLASEKQPRETILMEYRRAMEFLYDKEVRSLQKEGNDRRDYVASLYQTRGHSSDTSIDINFAIHVGLRVAQQMVPRWRVERVLVVGPGLDFAPRTGFRGEGEPQSYQPFLLADSLLRLGLAQPGKWRMQCIDLNPRVVDYFAKPPAELTVKWRPEEAEQRTYATSLGNSIGSVKGETIQLTPQPVQATRLNILTERLTGEPFDLIVATNVLLYFDNEELALAMANIQAMLKPGGFFLHNDLRAAVEQYSRLLGIPPLHARMVRLSARRQLYEGIVLHRMPE